MEKLLALIYLFIFLSACTSTTGENKDENVESDPHKKEYNEDLTDNFYHYSIWWAFVNRIFDGTLTAKELKTKGDIALGSYNALDGELVMLDGILYQVTEDGVVREAEDDQLIAYTNAVFFEPEQSFTLDRVSNYEQLRSVLNEQIPSKNVFYAFRIKGKFAHVKCGGLHAQEKPYDTGLDVLIPNRPIFERENFSGTMVGFYCPEFIGNINVTGYHLHFISDDEQFGGHLMEFDAENLNVEIDPIHKYTFELPQTVEFLNAGFEAEYQYGNK